MSGRDLYLSSAIPPIVVGGSGGSGTRVLTAILRLAGVSMGSNVNATDDALAFRPFNSTWIGPYLMPGAKLASSMIAHFHRCLADHCAGLPDLSRPWGWKRPETIFILPFLHQQLPGMVFLHVVRHGLDMAFASNQNDLLRYGSLLLERRFDGEPEPLRSLRLWGTSNLAAAHYAAQHPDLRYFRLHFETLCAQPTQTIAALFQFLHLPADPEASARFVTPPKSIGRWREKKDSELLIRLLEAVEPAFKYFGYWEEETYRRLLSELGPVRKSLLPAKSFLSRGRYLLMRLARAIRERRLLAALRKRLPERAR